MKNDYIIRKMYLSFVLVSILSALTATLGMLIDNIVVGRFLGTNALGAMGIVGPVSLIFSAFGNICSGGGTARAAQALGKGDTQRLNSIFSVTMLFVLASGALLTIVGLIFTPQIAIMLGAKGELYQHSVDYLRGFFMGAIPTIMTTALMGFVKIDGSPSLPLVCIIVMSAANIVLDILMAVVWNMGMFGMALATSISYCLAVLTSCTHFFKKDSTLKLVPPKQVGRELGAMVVTGAPTAVSRICDTIKVMVLNNILVMSVGAGAVAALNVRTQAGNFFGSLIMGLGQAAVPIVGMFFGEEDRSALRTTLKTSLKTGLIINTVAGLALFLAAPLFVSMIGVNEPEAAAMSVSAVRLYAVGMPLTLINTVMMSYYQSTRSTGMAMMICILQMLAFTVAFAALLVPMMGAMGVWLAFLLAELFTIATTVIVTAIKKHRMPRSIDDFMNLHDSFGSDGGDRLELSIGNSMDEVVTIARGISKFGASRSISPKTMNAVSLAIEEMAGNIVRHAFKPGEKRWFDLLIVNRADSLLIRMRDNGRAFDPCAYVWKQGKAEIEPEDGLGIRMISGLADGLEYRRTMGLNNLLITIKK